MEPKDQTTTRGIYGMGSLKPRTRADGSTVYRVQWWDDGKRRSKQFRHRDDALAFQGQRLTASAPRSPRGVTFGQAFESWFRGLAKAGDSTRDGYAAIYRHHLGSHFGDMRLDAITADEINRYLRARLDGEYVAIKGNRKRLSQRTLREHLWIMRSVYDMAIYVGEHTAPNPARAPRLSVSAVAGVKDMRKPRALDSTKKIKTFWGAVPSEHRAIIGTMLHAGLRWGETSALIWDDFHKIDADSSWLHIRRAVKHRGANVGEPKTLAGARNIPVAGELVQLLIEHKQKARDKSGDALIFPPDGSRGKYLRNYDIARTIMRPICLSPACVDAGIGHITPHMLRHTFAFIQINAGCPPSRLCRLMGHHSPSFTLARYGHFMADDPTPVAGLPTAPLAPPAPTWR